MIYHSFDNIELSVMDFTPEENTQIKLFDNSNSRHISLMQALDNINHSLGTKKVKLASQDIKKTWKMRQEKLSKHYTTRISEVIKIKA